MFKIEVTQVKSKSPWWGPWPIIECMYYTWRHKVNWKVASHPGPFVTEGSYANKLILILLTNNPSKIPEHSSVLKELRCSRYLLSGLLWYLWHFFHLNSIFISAKKLQGRTVVFGVQHASHWPQQTFKNTYWELKDFMFSPPSKFLVPINFGGCDLLPLSGGSCDLLMPKGQTEWASSRCAVQACWGCAFQRPLSCPLQGVLNRAAQRGH